MLEVTFTRQFEKDYALAKKRGKKVARYQAIVDTLARQEPLAPRHRPHRLSGNYAGYWECHLEPDYLLIYAYEPNAIVLMRMGTHSDLF